MPQWVQGVGADLCCALLCCECLLCCSQVGLTSSNLVLTTLQHTATQQQHHHSSSMEVLLLVVEPQEAQPPCAQPNTLLSCLLQSRPWLACAVPPIAPRLCCHPTAAACCHLTCSSCIAPSLLASKVTSCCERAEASADRPDWSSSSSTCLAWWGQQQQQTQQQHHSSNKARHVSRHSCRRHMSPDGASLCVYRSPDCTTVHRGMQLHGNAKLLFPNWCGAGCFQQCEVGSVAAACASQL